MAASDNLAAMEPWVYRPAATFADSWISEAFTRDTKALTMALQKSLMGDSNGGRSSESNEFLPFVDSFQTETTPTPTVSGVSGSDPESSAAAPMTTKRQRNHHQVPVASGKVTKRKSRASKRTQTTFITADPANFRQMVQQVTGVRFGNGDGNGQQFCSANTIVKPAPQRPGSGGCMLPTLDTSAFLFDRQQQQQQRQQYQQQQEGVGPAAVTGGVVGPMYYGRSEVVAGGGVSGGGLGFDSCSSFPTLESWS